MNAVIKPRPALSRPLWPGLVCWLLLVAGFAGQGLAGAHAQKGARLMRDEVLEAERRLSELGYWNGEADGAWDSSSRHALVAFQKVEGRERTGRLTAEELRALRNARRPQPLEGGQPHIEIDIIRQVLFVVDGEGAVVCVLPVSTGNEGRYFDHGEWHRAHTPRGRFTIQHKLSGWRRSTLGLLYYPSYFSGGFAIHGSQSVPVRPASHGCVRVPMFAARELSRLMPVGTAVVIHGGG